MNLKILKILIRECHSSIPNFIQKVEEENLIKTSNLIIRFAPIKVS